jgi:hypothetical protein
MMPSIAGAPAASRSLGAPQLPAGPAPTTAATGTSAPNAPAQTPYQQYMDYIHKHPMGTGAGGGTTPPQPPNTPTPPVGAMPPATPPPAGSTSGPGAIVGGAYGGDPATYDSPQDAYNRMIQNWVNNPQAHQYGSFIGEAPGFAGNAWLTYLMGDPYNRMISDSAEKQTLDNTNTAFDAARGKMKSDALQSGAAEGGVAKGESNALELAKGNTQAKNVRDFEQYKVDTGDKRLQQLLIPYLAQANNRQAGVGSNQGSSNDNTQQYLQYASLIASLFA